MTNQTPQEPQNQIPERRKRAAAGLTFDEMIGIFVALTTIGALLFWSLGSGKSQFANNSGTNGFGFGNIGKVGTKSDLDSARIDARSSKFTAQSPQSESAPLAAANKKAIAAKPEKPKAYKQNRNNVKKLAPVAGGIAASSAFLNGGNANAKPPASKPDTQANVGTKKPAKAKPKKPVDVPQDIDQNYWAYPFVKEMSDKGLVPQLTGDKNFEPDALVTRAGMATLISSAFDMESETQNVKKFKDVNDSNAVAADVDKAIKIGFMKGYSENTFRPDQEIPRYQVLVALATGLGLSPSGDPEATLSKIKNGTDIPDWAKKQVAAAAEAGLIVNRPNFDIGDLQPNESATRGEVAAMIHQALVNKGNLKSLKSEYILKP